MNEIGCVFLEEGINFENNKVCDCCISHNDGRGLPVLIEKYNGEPIDWEKLFDIKAKRIEAQKQATIYDCEGCYHLCNYEYRNERKISEFHFTQCRLCNSRCIYCSGEYSMGQINYSVYPIISDLMEKGYYKAGGEATFQGGEPTLMKDFDNVVNLLYKNGTRIRVHSSAIKYSETVEEALRNDKATIVISLDSATEKVYKKIKRVDAFKIVCNNIEKYVSAAGEYSQNIIIKYVIVPGFNDSVFEISKFFKLMKKLKVKTVAVDIEVGYARKYDNKNVSPHIYLLYDYFVAQAEKYDMKLFTYSFITYVLRNRTLKNINVKNKISFLWKLSKNREKRKNIKYKMY